MFNIFDLTQKDPKTLQERALKLAEEAGELAQAVLSATKAPGSEYKNQTLADVREEAADAVLQALTHDHEQRQQQKEREHKPREADKNTPRHCAATTGCIGRRSGDKRWTGHDAPPQLGVSIRRCSRLISSNRMNETTSISTPMDVAPA